jgi:voltage-gated potassium channel
MKTPLHRIRNGAFVLGFVFVIATCVFRFFGGYDWIGAVWMVVVTISTVGHGEHSTQSQAMQGFTVLVILLGMSASVYTIGGLIQLMLEGEFERIIGTRRMTQEIAKLSGHIVVCGFGRMGQDLAGELQRRHQTIVVVESNPALQSVSTDQGFIVYTGDATNEDVLMAVGVDRAKSLVSALPSDAENVFITLTARNLNPDMQIISRAELQSTEKKLQQAGANSVVMPTVVGARQMARMITHPATADLMELVSQSKFEDLELDEIKITSASGLAGVTVAQTTAWRKHNLLVVAVKRQSGEYAFNPNGDDSFQVADVVVVMGHRKDIERFRAEHT